MYVLLKYFICGGVGGICTVLVGHPLDTIKVRLQTMPKPKPGEIPKYKGALDCFKQTVAREGFLGLYKGMGAPLVAIAPIFAMSFMGYGMGLKMLGTPGQPYSYLDYFAAGSFSAIFTTSLMAPGERIKTLLQIQEGGPKLYDGPLDAIKKLYKQGGVRSIYRGTAATLARDIPAGGAYFFTYEAIRRYITENGKYNASILGTICAGGFAGVANWLVGMPPDVLKSRLQAAPEGTYPRGMRDVFVELMKNEGPGALYRGLVPVLMRAFPANGACFVGFEGARRFLDYVDYLI